MPTYHYKGIKTSGETTTGSIDAASRQQASKVLSSRGIRPTYLSEEQFKAKSKFLGLGLTSKKKGSLLKGKKNITQPFLSKLLQLHKSGMPVGDAIKTLSDRLTEPDQKELAQRIWQDLSEGLTLANSMKKFPTMATWKSHRWACLMMILT